MATDEPEDFKMPAAVPAPAMGRPDAAEGAPDDTDRDDPHSPDILDGEAPLSDAGTGASTSGLDEEDVSKFDMKRLGADLARALQAENYHPIILFGTNFSGKTSLLLSLLSTLLSEPRLETGVFLCDPVLGTETKIARALHEEARKLFEVKTQAFIEGENIPATKFPLPFFVPVEVRPAGKPPVRFAFLESNGEWYRPARERHQPIANQERLYPLFRTEIESFISSYQGGISFIYLTPYTQAKIFNERDVALDTDEIQNAALAIGGVLKVYDRVRANHRADDHHIMLVTKWDEHSARNPDRAEGIQEDRDALNKFCSERYGQAISIFQTLNLRPSQRQLNAYCSGIINERGLLQLNRGDDVRDVVMSYPIRLWSWLYRNALVTSGQSVVPLFREPPKPPTLVRLWQRLLDFTSGRS